MRFSTAVLVVATLSIASTGAMAGTRKYTLVGNDGTVYCDGLTLSTSDRVVYQGVHTGSCLSVNPTADGFAAHIKGFIPVLDIATTYPGNVDPYIFILSEKILAWNLYTDVSGVLTLVNYGTLAVGAPPGGTSQKRSDQR